MEDARSHGGSTIDAKPRALSPRARLDAAFNGAPVDRPPVCFWQHFPGRDHTAELLAAATVAFQTRYDLDLVKLMPTGMYSVTDYGVEIRPSADEWGTTEYVAGPIKGPSDWGRLPAVSPDRGALAQHVAVVRHVRAELGPDTPIIQTIFSPLTMAAKLVGGTLGDDVLAEERALRQALDRMADDVIGFGRACLQNGADGFFVATQPVGRAPNSGDVYERLGVSYDLKVLGALRPHCWGIVLHLHGADPPFELADRYPIDAVNWEDRCTCPSLAEALRRTRRCLMGGVGSVTPLANGTEDDVAAQVRDAIAQTGGRRLIVAPGCVAPLTAPERNLDALRSAVR